MGKLIVSNWTSLDGYIAGPSGEMDWILGEEQMGGYELGLIGEAEVMVFGGKTYREFSQFWPHVPANASANPFEQAFAAKINPLRKAVFSRKLDKPLWNDTTFHRSIDPTEVTALKKKAKGNLLIYGSASIVSQLLPHALIDEIHVVTHPILLGSGLRYFGGLNARIGLKRLSCTPLDSGATVLVFAPA